MKGGRSMDRVPYDELNTGYMRLPGQVKSIYTPNSFVQEIRFSGVLSQAINGSFRSSKL